MPEYPVTASAMKDRCFTVRYAFRPDSLDAHGTMQLEKDSESGGYSLKSENGEHTFGGSVTTAKEVECVLVWNQKEQAYELRQLDFALRMNPARENPQHSRHRRAVPSLATPPAARSSSTPGPAAKPLVPQDTPSPATTPSIGAGGRFRALDPPLRANQAAGVSEADDDGFDDLANELADELGVEPPAVRAIGTAGPNLDDEEEMSEEE